jgi:hypothetical protein
MALPPKGDPRRPLHLAIRSCRAVGGLLAIFGIFGILPLFISSGRRGMSPVGGRTAAFIASTFYASPAVAFYVLAVFLKKRQLWAVIVALVLASLTFVALFFGFLTIGLMMRTSSLLWRIDAILLAIAALVLFEAGRLIYQLARSFEAIRHLPENEARGFEPIFPVPPAAQVSDSDPQQMSDSSP